MGRYGGFLTKNLGAVGVCLTFILFAGYLVFSNSEVEASGSTFRTHVMPVAVGIYLPVSLSVPIFLGGLLRFLVSRARGERSEARDAGVLFGSGLIAGEALMGIGLAALVAGGIGLPDPFGGGVWWASLLIFGAVIARYWKIARA